jgi:F-type H+-transporting ATPase subunit d
MARAAATRIDWSRLLSIPISQETNLALASFRKKYDESKRILTSLQEQNLDINFEPYRSVLSNKKVVDEAEKAFKNFKPVKMDAVQQVKVIEQLEAKAV